MSKGYRPQKLAEEIRKIVSEMLVKGDLKDPGFKGMIGINSVEVTNDGSYATLYVTSLGLNANQELREEDKNIILGAFQKSKGFIRSEIGKKVKIRHIPELLFKFDTSVQYGLKMDKILNDLNIPDYEENSEEDA